MAITYRSAQSIYDPGEIPQCTYCRRGANKVVLYDTPVNGITVCERERCLLRFCRKEFDRIRPRPKVKKR